MSLTLEIKQSKFITPKKTRVANTKYYSEKGRLWHSINAKTKTFNIDKVEFKDCKTIEDINLKAREILKTRGLDDKIIERLVRIKKNKSTYTPRKKDYEEEEVKE